MSQSSPLPKNPSCRTVTTMANTMNKESRYIIIKGDGKDRKYLRHQGHAQYWSSDRLDAMEYTRIDVAQGLAAQHKGKVEAA